ncbi:HNH endonuclease [Sanguibacter sp. YZGR15]|uniref:HNH endonuclease n=1 Tax=Sanguibacter suaedae TaxID=2795737 RepID=A0A934M603_9MICO|nr:HNH endonuclease [Sanguibacter suaedae]
MRQVELDHIFPRLHGGNDSAFNRQGICARCNNIEGNQ